MQKMRNISNAPHRLAVGHHQSVRRRRRNRARAITSICKITQRLLLLLLPSTIIRYACAQSIQGYVYWDQNGNGRLEENVIANELENGVIDVSVNLKSCGGDGEGEFLSCMNGRSAAVLFHMSLIEN